MLCALIRCEGLAQIMTEDYQKDDASNESGMAEWSSGDDSNNDLGLDEVGKKPKKASDSDEDDD